MTILVNSFDFDGCLFNINYIMAEEKDVIAYNQAMLDSIKAKISDYHTAITLVGSNRQSKEVDDTNHFHHNTGSCFPAIKTVNNYLGATLDTFLLADIYGELPDGTSYERAMDPSCTEHAGWHFDLTKASLIYAQIHKIANNHRNEPITFDFYDDNRNIITDLQYFFTKFPQLIPNNVTFRVFYYAGQKPVSHFSVAGTGFIDANYRKTVKQMTQISSESKDREKDLAVVAYDVTPELLTARTAKLAVPASDTVVPEEATRQIPAIDSTAKASFLAQLELIQQKADELRKNGHILAAETAQTLHDTIRTSSTNYFSGNLSGADFKQTCAQALNQAQPILEKHRGWKQILGNIALAIVGLGVGYLIAAVVNRFANGHFTFFHETDSAKKLRALEGSVQQVATPVSA